MIEGQANEVTTTVDLSEEGGWTHVTLTNLCVSKEARDLMAKCGTEAAAKASPPRLVKCVESTGGESP